MARVYPDTPLDAVVSIGLASELEVVGRLASGLSDAFTLFHGLEWSAGAAADERHGEVDVVVVNQSGDLMLMEVKSGEVEFRPEGIFKRYGPKTRNVTAQVRMQYGALRNRLQRAGLSVELHHLLVLPDLQVRSETVQWPRERIIDCDDLATLVPRVMEQLGPGVPSKVAHDRVIAFLENCFQVAPDVSALAGRVQQASTRLAAGLATWVPRITAPSGLIRVVGTAGSGKTQLALRLLRDAAAAGERARYVCFNRALADHMARVAPVQTPAETFHEHAVSVCRRAGIAVDFSLPGVFERVAAACIDSLRHAEPDLDLLVLDEGQDLQPEWVEALLSRLRTNGCAVLMEDPAQQLYVDRVAFDVADAVTVTSHENFRTPRALVRLINTLRLVEVDVEAMSPYEGEIPDPIVYNEPDDVVGCTVKAVERCLQRGFGIDDIAVISLRGRERSLLQGLDRLGSWGLRRFAGRYDAGGAAIWAEGQLLIDSVRRFKGQAAGAIVLSECDLAELDPLSRRLLFVGLTRARVHLEWVVSARTASVLEGALRC